VGTSTGPAVSLTAEPLLSLAVTVTSEQRVESVLQSIVQGLASQPGVALARIWLLPSVHLPSFCHAVSDRPDYLCLVASAGTPINSPGEDWSFLQGHFARMPSNVGKVGQIAASRHAIFVKDVAVQNDWVVRPDWAKREEIRSFAGHPLIFRDKLLGVVAVFSRQPLGQQEFAWLGLFANQAAVAIANACTEEALRSSERNLAAIINTIPMAAWTTRPDGYCDFLNQVWVDYTSMTAEQAQGWGWAEAIHPDDRKKLVELWQSCLASGTPIDTEARIRRFDSSYRWFLIRGNPLKDQGDNILKWYGTCVDIEGRKRAEEALNRARSELAHVTRLTTLNALTASIAHEVSQPLSSIVSGASASLRFLSGDAPNLEEAREAVHGIVRDGKRAVEIITRTRALTKKTTTRREKLDLNETISEVLALIGDEAMRHRVIVRTQFADALAPVAGDRVQLQQVVLNLVMNAIEAMNTVSERPRELVITTQNINADCVQATVEDSGTGIASDTVDKIFESFYTTKAGGMGMGLPISRSILQSHGGRLWAVSKDAPGTIFHFTIPKYHEEGAHAPATGT
jgi:PAS domain S-box-containing protein